MIAVLRDFGRRTIGFHGEPAPRPSGQSAVEAVEVSSLLINPVAPLVVK
jgi:hypothetical protein